MNIDRQKAFVKALQMTFESVPLNQSIEPQVTDALVRELPGLEPFKVDLGTLLSFAFDIHVGRVVELKRKLDARVRQWERDQGIPAAD